MLKFLGKKRKRQLLRSLSSDPLSEGQPGYRDSFLCLAISEPFAIGPAGWPKIGLLNRDLGRILSVFPRNTRNMSKHSVH